MLLIKVVPICLLLLFGCFVAPTFAQAVNFDNTNEQSVSTTSIFNISPTIEQLNRLAMHSPKLAQKQLLVSEFDQHALNPAEQYLLLLTKAKIALSEQKYNDAIALLTTVETLAAKLSKLQLQSDSFNQAYLLLSQAYAYQLNYQQAYLTKKTYLNNYFDNIEYLRAQEVEALKLKYETRRKDKENELLESKNKITQQKIEEANQANIAYQREKIVLILLSLVFIGMLIRQVIISRDLRTLAKKDNLTGLLNRSNAFKRGQALVDNFRETKQVFCVLMLDIDNFKAINDNFGHDVGDQVIKKVAQIGKDIMRSRDIFARIGGEEFVAIFPGTKLAASVSIAERFKEKLHQTSFASLGINNSITASFGLSCVTLSDADFETLLNTADQAMYRAKRNGRNQVVNYTPQINADLNKLT
ncbi:GGDEF domain-containing protein [Thalassotalea sp. PLHSN55]|uniref:GGDEF domain-containing protein n=1 Tax=Thalassotalea sp. PLHSN55 TaxID=3435888 RepID=UPI003F8600AD